MMGGVSLSVIGNLSVPFYIAKKLRYKIPPQSMVFDLRYASDRVRM